MSPENAVQAAIYQRLSTALAPLAIYDFVPEDAHPPYVVIGDDTSADASTKTGLGWDFTVTIHCWDFEQAGRKSVKSVLSDIYDALHRQESALTVAGFTLIELRWDGFSQTFQDASVEGQNDRFYHGVTRFRVLVEQI